MTSELPEQAVPAAPRVFPSGRSLLADDKPIRKARKSPASRLLPRSISGRSIFPQRNTRAFTLIEVLAALVLIAIVVPVAMQGMSVASRAGVMGQRKAAAMRVAERVLNELVISGEALQSSASGTTAEGDTSYPWTLESANWTEDAMMQVTVRVTYVVQGDPFTMSATTLVDPLAGASAVEAIP